jgi:hypothetical protein
MRRRQLVTRSQTCSGSTDTRPLQSHDIDERPGQNTRPGSIAFP